jgi:uncharacterized membrane protein YgaE (UPF0421/DUF939 family)
MDFNDFLITIIGSLIGSAITFYFAQNKFKFESLHKKRFEVLEEIYKKLLITHAKAKIVLESDARRDPDVQIRYLNSYHESLTDAYEFVKEKNIFLSNSEQELVNRFFREVENFENNLGYKRFMEIMPSPDFDRGKTITEIRNGVYVAVPTILTEIENEFKIALGLKL